jgi:cytochrome c556
LASPCDGTIEAAAAPQAGDDMQRNEQPARPRLTRAFASNARFIACVLAALWLSWAGSVAWAQSEAAPPPKDTIFARKIVMGMIDRNMDEVEGMLAPGGKLAHADAREHLDNISVMLMAFPHMFAASTNQWKPGADRDPALDTFASPDVWTSYDDFYKRAADASKIAFAASRAKRIDEFRALLADLRTACDSCHAGYLKTQ